MSGKHTSAKMAFFRVVRDCGKLVTEEAAKHAGRLSDFNKARRAGYLSAGIYAPSWKGEAALLSETLEARHGG